MPNGASGIGRRGRRWLVLSLLSCASTAVLVSGAHGNGGQTSASERVRQGLERAVGRAALSQERGAQFLEILARASRALERLRGQRHDELAGVLADVAAQAGRFNEPRALALFGMLDTNIRYFGSRALPPSPGDVEDADGVVYRYVAGHGFQFHPLASFAQLNRKLDSPGAEGAAPLAAALLARGVAREDALVWEYYFPYARADAAWTSGMVQAVAARAFQAASAASGAVELAPAARRAFLGLRRLLVALPAGPWVRLYGFNRLLVLNAQLQATLSLRSYAEAAGDVEAAALAAQLEATTRRLLPRFDTGFWSLYSLGGREAPLGYHEYVISLLRRLASVSGDPFWRDAATRFDAYITEPPVVKPGRPSAAIYPRPADGFRDWAKIRFWLSKRSHVTIVVGGERLRFRLPRGPHVVFWGPGPHRRPGPYVVKLAAVGPAGTRAEAVLERVEIRRPQGPPRVEAKLHGRRLVWHGADESTPWLALRLRLRTGSGSAIVRLGKRPLSGSAHVELPRGRWAATLLAANSSGWTAQAPLGLVTGVTLETRQTALRTRQ